MNINKLICLILFLVVMTGCQTQNGENQIAFSRLSGDNWQLFTVRLDSKELTQLTTSPSDKRYPFWSKLKNRLYYRNNNNQAYFIDLSSNEEVRILNSLGMISNIAVSPNETQLLLVRFRTELKDSSDLWLVPLEDQTSKRLTWDAGMQYDPCWSPDGNTIVYISGTGYQDNEIYSMNHNGKNRKQLTDNTALELLPSFSPDGKTIAYTSDITGNYDIWLMNANGTDQRQITHYSGLDTRPIWSPDGTKLLFVSDRSGQQQLWIMHIDGSNARQITVGLPSIDPTWKF
ncbi:TolB family protein [Planctomycetota bacterium]